MEINRFQLNPSCTNERGEGEYCVEGGGEEEGERERERAGRVLLLVQRLTDSALKFQERKMCRAARPTR